MKKPDLVFMTPQNESEVKSLIMEPKKEWSCKCGQTNTIDNGFCIECDEAYLYHYR